MSEPVASWMGGRVEDLGEVVSGGTPSQSNSAYWNGAIPWVTPSEITALKGKYLSETRERITEEGLAGSAACILPTGSVVVTTRATLGEAAIAAMPLTTNQGFKSIVPNASTHSVFAYYLLRSMKRLMERMATGTTFLEISKADFVRLPLRRPSVEEQGRIAAVLDTMDAEIEKKEAVIAKLKQIRDGLLHDLLTRGLDEHGRLRDPIAHPEQFRDSPPNLSPINWEEKRLDEMVASAVDGPFGSNLKTEHYSEHPGVRVVRLQNIATGRFDDSDEAFIPEEHAATLQRHQVVAGDLLVAAMGDDNHPIARACLYPNDMLPGIVKADCFRLRMREGVALNAFVMLVLNCPSARRRMQMNALGQGVTRERVNLTTLLRLRISCPLVDEQQAIVERMEAADEEVERSEEALAKLQALKCGLMADLLTGRVRVPVNEPSASSKDAL